MKMSSCLPFMCIVLVSVCYSGVYCFEVRDSSQPTLDSYCQQVYFNGSYLCRNEYSTGYDYACASLYCYDAIYLKKCMYSIPPQDSTLCGNGKWCDAHSCVDSPNAEVTSDDCPLGDSSKPDIVFGMSCEEIVGNRPSLCGLADVGKLWCCESCANVTKAEPATFTGTPKSAEKDCQELFGQNSYFCQTDARYNGDYSSLCTTMYCYDPANGTCVPYPANDAVPCGDGKWCVAGQCVQSANASPNPYADCLYGNQYQAFCVGNVAYPNVAKYCGQYESGCCSACLQYKNASNAGCEYGDLKPDVCKDRVRSGTIKSDCVNDEATCCDTCANLKATGDASCPYGDVDQNDCERLMNDTIGPGNCYSQTHAKECCETCPQYYNASLVGCEYGDHWKDYCADNVKPPNVASACGKYESQCCGSCRAYEQQGHPGCRYGDRDPDYCAALMGDNVGSANCYDSARRSRCCATCENLKDESTPDCLYGDNDPTGCAQMFNDSRGYGHCYDLSAQIDCCRSCEQAKNDSNVGCEYGDRLTRFCNENIISNETAFLCFNYENECCESCADYVVSDNTDCKYGDKDPSNCRLMIPDEESARRRCATVGIDCCATCSYWGHPGPAGSISTDIFVG